MMLRVIELLIAWHRGHITDAELLDELRPAMAQATRRWNL